MKLKLTTIQLIIERIETNRRLFEWSVEQGLLKKIIFVYIDIELNNKRPLNCLINLRDDEEVQGLGCS